MIGNRGVTFKARIPKPATLEFDRDDIELATPMRAASFGINIEPTNFFTVYLSHS